MPEIFKDIEGYKGLYQISNHGRVKSLERKAKLWQGDYRVVRERILKPSINKGGYYIVGLYKDGKRKSYLIHIIEWDAHSEIKRNRYEVDHIDEIKSNNMFWNFQLLTPRQNVSKGHLRRGKKTSEYTGVCWHKHHKKWRISIQINGKDKHLGYFDDEYKAHLCYENARKELGYVG